MGRGNKAEKPILDPRKNPIFVCLCFAKLNKLFNNYPKTQYNTLRPTWSTVTYTYIIIHDKRNKVTRGEEALLGKEMAESESSHADVGEGEAIAPDDTSE